MQQQFGLADTPPTVEQDELGWPWALASDDPVEKGQFLFTVDKHYNLDI